MAAKKVDLKSMFCPRPVRRPPPPNKHVPGNNEKLNIEVIEQTSRKEEKSRLLTLKYPVTNAKVLLVRKG